MLEIKKHNLSRGNFNILKAIHIEATKEKF
jgi:hypothetical protein